MSAARAALVLGRGRRHNYATARDRKRRGDTSGNIVERFVGDFHVGITHSECLWDVVAAVNAELPITTLAGVTGKDAAREIRHELAVDPDFEFVVGF